MCCVTVPREFHMVSFNCLLQVNITLQDSECTLGATINYVATATDEKLPATFSSEEYVKVKILDPIDFTIDDNRTVATILAPWLNLTIVVTKYDGYLGVVLRMAADLGFGSEGLCSNSCPAHSVMDIEAFKKNSSCSHDANSALYGCTINTDLNSVLEGAVERTDLISIPFIKVCQFDVLQSLSYGVMSFMRAIADQYSILPNVAPYITPEPFDPDIVPPILTTTTTPTTTTPMHTSMLKASPTTVTTVSTTTTATTATTGPSSAADQVTSTEAGAAPTNFARAELPSSSGVLAVNRLVLALALLVPLFLLYRY